MAYVKAITGQDAAVMGDGTLQVIVQFSGDSGEQAEDRTFNVHSFADLQAQVASVMAQLNQSETDFVKIPSGTAISAPTMAVVQMPPALTPEQQFFADLEQLLSLSGALAAGVFPSTDKTYAALLQKVQSEFVSSYVNDAGWPR